MDYDEEDYIIATICIDVLIISTCLTEFILLTNKCYQGKLDPIEILLSSLCLSDLFSGIVSLVIDTLIFNKFLNHIIPAIFDCLFMFFLLSTNFHVMSMAVGRFVAVISPTKYFMYDSMKRNKYTLCFIWTSAVILAPSIYVISRFVVKGFTKLYGSIFATASSVTLVTYVLLFIMLISRDGIMREVLHDAVRQRIRRESFLCLLLGISFFICILPYALGLLSRNLYHPVWNLLVTLNHLVNPIIYFIKHYIDKRERSTGKVDITLNTEELMLTTI